MRRENEMRAQGDAGLLLTTAEIVGGSSSSGSKFSGNELGSAEAERPVFISILRN